MGHCGCRLLSSCAYTDVMKLQGLLCRAAVIRNIRKEEKSDSVCPSIRSILQHGLYQSIYRGITPGQ